MKKAQTSRSNDVTRRATENDKDKKKKAEGPSRQQEKNPSLLPKIKTPDNVRRTHPLVNTGIQSYQFYHPHPTLKEDAESGRAPKMNARRLVKNPSPDQLKSSISSVLQSSRPTTNVKEDGSVKLNSNPKSNRPAGFSMMDAPASLLHGSPIVFNPQRKSIISPPSPSASPSFRDASAAAGAAAAAIVPEAPAKPPITFSQSGAGVDAMGPGSKILKDSPNTGSSLFTERSSLSSVASEASVFAGFNAESNAESNAGSNKPSPNTSPRKGPHASPGKFSNTLAIPETLIVAKDARPPLATPEQGDSKKPAEFQAIVSAAALAATGLMQTHTLVTSNSISARSSNSNSPLMGANGVPAEMTTLPSIELPSACLIALRTVGRRGGAFGGYHNLTIDTSLGKGLGRPIRNAGNVAQRNETNAGANRNVNQNNPAVNPDDPTVIKAQALLI